MSFRFSGMGFKMQMKSPLKSMLGAHRPTNDNQDNKISERMTTTDAMSMNRVKSPLKSKSPLKKYGDPPPNDDNTETSGNTGGNYTSPVIGGKREKDTKGVEGIYDYNPEEGGSSSESENGAGGDYSSKMYDKNTGYFNPWETLAKEILQPSSKNAENRVKTRQANRIKTLETKGASEEKMTRVKSRQASENNRRFATKKTSKTNGKTTTAENESATTSK